MISLHYYIIIGISSLVGRNTLNILYLTNKMKPDLEQYFKVQTSRYAYYLCITTRYHFTTGKPISYYIDVGGMMKGCVRIVVEVPSSTENTDERFRNIEMQKSCAFISWIGYNNKCSILGNLESGDGTRHMVRTAMTVVLNTFNWIKEFELTDASKVQCENGIEISLSELSFVVHAKSYYEKYFKAYLLNEENRQRYYDAQTMLKDRNTKLPLDDFVSLFRIFDKDIHKVYQNTDTYLDFFNRLKIECKRHGENHFCKILHPWIHDFIMYVFKANGLGDIWMSNWRITKDSVKEIQIKDWNEVYEVEEVRNVFQEKFKEYYQNGGFKNGSFILGDLE
jgi:hypothetical protein